MSFAFLLVNYASEEKLTQLHFNTFVTCATIPADTFYILVLYCRTNFYIHRIFLYMACSFLVYL